MASAAHKCRLRQSRQKYSAIRFMLGQPVSVQDNDRLLAVVGAVLAHAAHEELFDAALIVLGHHHSWSLQVLSSDADDFSNGILVCVEVCDLDLMRNLM